MGEVAQLLGYLLVVAGAFLLWGPWALLAGGAVLLVVPEIVQGFKAGVSRRDAAAATARTR